MSATFICALGVSAPHALRQRRKLEWLTGTVLNQITAYAAACHPTYSPAQWHTALILYVGFDFLA